MPNIRQVSFTTPGAYEYQAEQDAIEQRRKLAEALQAQGMAAPSGTEMVSGWAVKQSPWAGLAKGMQTGLGMYQQDKARQEEKALGEKMRTDYQSMLAKGLRQLQGTPEQQNAAVDDPAAGQYSPASTTPAVPPDPTAALGTFGSHPGGAAMMPLAMQQIQQQQRAQMLAKILQQQPGAPAGGAPTAGGQPGQPPQGGQGGFAQGIPPQIMGLMTSGDPELAALGKALLEANKGIAQRPGAPVVNPFTGAVIAQPTPAVPAGVGLNVGGPNGPRAYPVPGAIPAMAGVASSESAARSGGTQYGEAPYQASPVNTEQGPRLLTRQQQIEGATGRPMPMPYGMAPQPQPAQRPQVVTPQFPRETPAQLTGAGSRQLEILNGEAKQYTDAGRPVPPDLAMEISNAQARASGRYPPRASNPVMSNAPGLRLQGEARTAEDKEYGKNLGEYHQKIIDSAANAAVANRYLDIMETAAKDIRLGKLAPAQSALTQWAQSVGLNVSDDAKKAAGSTQALTSMAIKMAGQATRQADAQPSQLQYFKILESMPNEARTEDGFNKIVSYLRDTNNYNIAKMQSLQQWKQQHGGTADGFEAAWPDMAKNLPFVWNQGNKAANLKGIVASGKDNDPLGIRR